MASYALLHDLTSRLQKNLFQALDTSVDVDFDLSAAASDILPQPPSEAQSNNAAVSLYLYHMDINGHLRNQPMVSIGTEALVKPPLPFRVRYLITPVSDEHLTNQLILGRLIQFLYDNPILTSSEDLTLSDARGGTTELRIHPDNLSIEALNQLWTAMGESYRLCYSFSVDIVTIDSAKAPVAAQRVGASSQGGIGA